MTGSSYPPPPAYAEATAPDFGHAPQQPYPQQDYPPPPQQPGYPPQQPGFAQQGYPGAGQQAYPPQPGAAHQGYPPQPGAAQQGYPPQPGAAQQGYPPQPGAAHQGYPPQPGAYPPQPAYAQQGYPQQQPQVFSQPQYMPQHPQQGYPQQQIQVQAYPQAVPAYPLVQGTPAYQQPQTVIIQQGQVQMDWSSGICDFSDQCSFCASCGRTHSRHTGLTAAFCPCIAYGQIKEQMGQGCFAPGCLWCCLAVVSATFCFGIWNCITVFIECSNRTTIRSAAAHLACS